MIEFTSLEECSFQRDDHVVVALGFFDGIHLAHQRLIQECKNKANLRKGTSVIFTFQNHPSSVLDPEHPTPLLTPYLLKRQLLQSMDIDAVVSVPFDVELCHTPAMDFVQSFLVEKMHACELVVGFNFRFGHRREGSAELLQSCVPHLFEQVTVIEQQFFEDIAISSSFLRKALIQGQIQEVASLLGRPYPIAGTVIRGDGRGRTIGIPTANLDTQNQLLPPNGVYGVRVHLDQIESIPLWGVMNIGTLPTFTDQTRQTVEIHLLDYEEDIYGRFCIAEIMEFLREERKFSGIDELLQQIRMDIRRFQSHIAIQSKNPSK